MKFQLKLIYSVVGQLSMKISTLWLLLKNNLLTFYKSKSGTFFSSWSYSIDFILATPDAFYRLRKFKVVFEIQGVKAGEFIRLLMVGAN